MRRIFFKILLAAMLSALFWVSANGQDTLHFKMDSVEYRNAFRSLRLHDSIGDKHSEIQDLISISWLLTNAAELDKSMECLQKARQLCDETADSTLMANVTLLLADNYKSIGAFNTAYRYYQEADSIFSMTGNIQFHIFTQFCKAYCKQNEYEHTGSAAAIDTAIALIKRQRPLIDSLRPEHKIPMMLIVSRVLISKSICVAGLPSVEFLREAISLSQRGRLEAVRLGNRTEEFFDINEADALIRLDSLDKARILLGNINEDSLSKTQQSILYPIKCNFYQKTGQYSLALKYFKKSMVLYNKTFNTENALLSHRFLAEMRYHKLMEQYDVNKRSREIEFQKESKNQRLRNNILKINAIIALAIMALLIVNAFLLKRENKRLSAAKSEIERQNVRLLEIHDTTTEQTIKIQKQLHTLGEQARIAGIFRSRMEKAISLAQSIQNAMMASQKSLDECLNDYFIYWKPVAPVSGDFYWLRKAGQYSYLAVCDATGHGVPGALLSMLGMSMLNDIAVELDLAAAATSTGAVLDCLKERFEKLLGTGSSKVSDSIDVALIKIDKASKKIQFSGANRPLVVVSDGEAMEFKPTRMCIGYNVLDRGNFISNAVDYDSGDMILLFSDGLPDQFGGLDGHTKFGTKRLYELLSSIYDLPLSVQRTAIGAVFQQWTHMDIYNINVNQIDDQIVLGIRM